MPHLGGHGRFTGHKVAFAAAKAVPECGHQCWWKDAIAGFHTERTVIALTQLEADKRGPMQSADSPPAS